jgi:hypothetical protein
MADLYGTGMSKRPQRENQSNDTREVIRKDYRLNELDHFINSVHVEARIDERTIKKVTGKVQLIETQIKFLVGSREFGTEWHSTCVF